MIAAFHPLVVVTHKKGGAQRSARYLRDRRGDYRLPERRTFPEGAIIVKLAWSYVLPKTTEESSVTSEAQTHALHRRSLCNTDDGA